jgi:post-segregation antitoxin (ccd killing protein)
MGVTYIPPGITLLELLEAFHSEAEVALHNYEMENENHHERIRQLEAVQRVADARVNYAKTLLHTLRTVMVNISALNQVPIQMTLTSEKYSLSAFYDWAEENLGLTLFDKSQPYIIKTEASTTIKDGSETTPESEQTQKIDNLSKSMFWTDITIELRPNDFITVKNKDQVIRRVSLSETQFTSKQNGATNISHGLLVALSDNYGFIPRGNDDKEKGKRATQITRLGAALKKLVPEAKDVPINLDSVTDKYVPRFALLDRRNDENERARKNSPHIEYNEETDAGPSDS